MHCISTPASATISACDGPSRSNDARMTAYDTDSVEPFAIEIGSVTFHEEETHANRTRTANSTGDGYVTGNQSPRPIVPERTTRTTYTRALTGREFQGGPAGVTVL